MPVNVDRLQHWIDRGLLDPSRPITARELYESSRTQASAVLPLEVGERLLGAVGLAFDEVRAWHPADRELVEALAALTAQALDRLAALEA